MGNPILNLAMRANPMAQVLSNMFGMAKNSGNMTEALNQMAVNDPRMAQVMAVIQQHNGDAMAALRDVAQQRGVDPNYAIEQVRGMIGN